MLEQVKILTSRRAYEFHPDDLRLSTLCTKPVQEQIQQLFHFQTTLMGSPMATFGDVPATFPPGIVFDMGVWIFQDKQLVPIRFLHFEQRRIVIDVAGPSSAITAIFEHLRQFLSQLQAADGSPVIGEPERVLEYTEISAQFLFPLDKVFSPSMRKFFAKSVSEKASEKEEIPIPILVIQPLPPEQEYAGVVNVNHPRSFTLALRAGSHPEEHVYFSAAPLDSEAHLSYLNELDTALTSG